MIPVNDTYLIPDASWITTLPTIVTSLFNSDDASNDVCTPYDFTNTTSDACAYVKYFADACEGGGYLQWTEYIVCTDDPTSRGLLIALAITIMFYLFLWMSTAADDFFCAAISAIVDHLKISQSVAGVTFLAFGNGAPDIFSTLASILNTDSPKAGLAIGDLLGGGCFVTTVVLGVVMITKPFNISRTASIRDILFYLVAVGWMAFICFYDDVLHLWQPLVYLIMYAVYATTVMCGRLVLKCYPRKKPYLARTASHLSACSASPSIDAGTINLEPPRPSVMSLEITPDHERRRKSLSSITTSGLEQTESRNSTYYQTFPTPVQVITEPVQRKGSSREPEQKHFVIPNIIISPVEGSNKTFVYVNGGYEYNDTHSEHATEDDSTVVVIGPPSSHRRRYTVISESDSRKASATVLPTPPPELMFRPDEKLGISRIVHDLLKALNPVESDFRSSKWYSKVLQVLKIPIMIILKLTMPVADDWCKSLAMIQAFTMPITFVFAFGLTGIRLIPNFPGIWLYAIILSLILATVLFFLTTYNRTPKYHQQFAAYIGFIMSVAWIYLISSEVVGIIVMISVLSKIPHEILGLTVMAWSNSIGDMVADIAVAKQGFPQMGASAAIGGPLFNLLFGFGLSFFIATVQGKQVQLKTDMVTGILLIGLTCSLVFTIIVLLFNRFHAKRIHGTMLIVLYGIFVIALVIQQVLMRS
uniref:Sodium/potassium/calcium exchanger 6 n=1 Tax=Panagrellus redivivus TaxID=6233 RepID=A0A7E4VGV2_PANRE